MVTYRCDDELYHFGIKGMKWGVRKAIEGSANTTKKLWFGRNGYTSHVRKHVKSARPDPRDTHLIFDRPVSFGQFRNNSEFKGRGKFAQFLHENNIRRRTDKYNRAIDDYAWHKAKGNTKKANKAYRRLNNLTNWYSPKYDLSLKRGNDRDVGNWSRVDLVQKTKSYNSLPSNKRIRDELIGIRDREYRRLQRTKGWSR